MNDTQSMIKEEFMKKKFLVCLLSLAMLLPVVGGSAACGENKDDGSTYNITVWVGEGTDTLTKQQIEKFNETNEFGVKFNATIEVVSESKAAGNAISTPASCADIFCFAQDQLARVVHSNLLMPLNREAVESVESNCDAGSIDAAKIGGTIRAFPFTSDNGYFMFYDKRVVSEEHIGSLEDILADCEKAGKNFSMNLTKDGGSWYAASFFYATGCKSEWTTDGNGNFTDYEDNFLSDEGVIALQGMQKLLKSDVYNPSAEVSDFNAAIPSAVVVSGIWGYKAAEQSLGENLGIAPLPAFTVDGESYQLVSYLGSKLMGVKPQSDSYRAAYLQKLAIYLTSEAAQKERFEEVGWGPSNIKAAQQASSPALDVLARAKTTLQGQYPTNWWSKVDVMTGSAQTSESDEATLKALLTTYNNALNDLKKDAE